MLFYQLMVVIEDYFKKYLLLSFLCKHLFLFITKKFGVNDNLQTQSKHITRTNEKVSKERGVEFELS